MTTSTYCTNMASFIARLASVGVCKGTLTGLFIVLLRDTLETHRRINAADSGSEVPIEELLPAIRAWVTVC
jgi:hypothetical protein